MKSVATVVLLMPCECTGCKRYWELEFPEITCVTIKSSCKVTKMFLPCIFPLISAIGSFWSSHFFIFLYGSLPSSENFSYAFGLLRISEALPWDLFSAFNANCATGILFSCNRPSTLPHIFAVSRTSEFGAVSTLNWLKSSVREPTKMSEN